MSDKLKQSVAIIPVFSAGESPSPEKLNVMALQFKKAMTVVEKAIGDIHGDSWPYSSNTATRLSLAYGSYGYNNISLSGSTERALDIANLARLIGPASNLNPRSLGDAVVTENVPVGVYEFSLKHIPKTPINASHPVFSDTGSFINFKANKWELEDLGDYHVSSDGRVYKLLDQPGIQNPGTVTYNYSPSETYGGSNYQGASFNTIPDPNQANLGVGLTVGALNGDNRHPVSLPTVTHQQSNEEGNSVALSAVDANFNQQLYLPKVLVDNFVSGEEIPSGFLYLKNYTSGLTYTNATYFYIDAETIEVGNVDLTNEISAGDVFVLFTVGTDITTSIDDLRIKQAHTHDRTKGEPFVDVDGIVGFTRHIPMGASEIPSNFAPQYLHRYGFEGGLGYDQTNWNLHNSMLGDINFAYLNTTRFVAGSGATWGIKFRDSESIYVDADGNLVINNINSFVKNSSDANSIFLDGRVKVGTGLDGDHGELNSVAIKSYALNTVATPSGAQEISIVLPTSFANKHIYSVTGFIAETLSDVWYSIPNVLTGRDIYINKIDYSGATPEIVINVTGAAWSGEINLQLRLVVWYANDSAAS